MLTAFSRNCRSEYTRVHTNKSWDYKVTHRMLNCIVADRLSTKSLALKEGLVRSVTLMLLFLILNSVARVIEFHFGASHDLLPR